VNIRPASIADAEACRAIYAPYVADSWVSFETEPPDVVVMAERIAQNCASHGWFIAELDGQVAGYAYGSAHRTRQAYQTSCDVAVYVDSSHGRKGVGRALYRVLLPHLRERGFHAAFAGIALPNPGSIALHEAYGFTPVGIYREVGWKLGGWRDVGWWQTLL
jgi:phosphinothricin acetyltransferase